MASTGEFSYFDGSISRLVVGTTIIVYLLVYNEACPTAIIFGNMLTFVYALMACYCRTSLRSLQMPYIRASNKFDFTCLFLASWMEVLAILCACAALAHTISTCLDAMTDGMAHILILGRNSSANEPWPDVLGVAVVFIIAGMFMLGLENSNVFTGIMIIGMILMNALPFYVTYYNGDLEEWSHDFFRPDGVSTFLTAAALLTFAYPRNYPIFNSCMSCYTESVHLMRATLLLTIAGLVFSTLVHFKSVSEYVANPVFTMLDEQDLRRLVPAIACLLMLTCSGAFLELFPELYGHIMRFATAEWKVFSKQISYESPDSGNPVLAIFISGSLCAMLAFACPMQILIHILAASHICSGLFRAFYLLYTPYRPKYIQPNSANSSLSYSRLATAPIVVRSSSSVSRNKISLWNASLVKKSAIKKPKLKKKLKKELEKEWLLLGEPNSPYPVRAPQDVESAILSDGDKSDSDTSTDIDAIVDEYRQKIKVTTVGLMELNVRIPTLCTWRLSKWCIAGIIFSVVCASFSCAVKYSYMVFVYISACLLASTLMSLIPRYRGNVVNVSPVLCTATLMIGGILLGACLYYSWPAIVYWLIAGILLVLRCDNWCCGCFEYSGGSIQKQLLPSISADTMTTKATTICIPHLPKRIVTIPTRVNATSR